MQKPIDIKVTREGFEDLKNEYEELTKKRPLVLKRMVEAREQGDLSENAGYHASREELSQTDGRLRELKLMIRLAEVVDKAGTDKVSLGNKVKLETDGKTIEYTIVSAQEADPVKNKLSDVSPLGNLLLGRKTGEKVILKLPGIETKYKILGVSS
ncbi:MAG TPA: transcription elongation factor GreA [Patescibacteria group bacterium]